MSPGLKVVPFFYSSFLSLFDFQLLNIYMYEIETFVYSKGEVTVTQQPTLPQEKIEKFSAERCYANGGKERGVYPSRPPTVPDNLSLFFSFFRQIASNRRLFCLSEVVTWKRKRVRHD